MPVNVPCSARDIFMFREIAVSFGTKGNNLFTTLHLKDRIELFAMPVRRAQRLQSHCTVKKVFVESENEGDCC